MALSTEIILTLQLLDGIGNKTILKIANSTPYSIQSIEQLCQFWKTLKGKKMEYIDTEDLEDAYRKALNLLSRCQEEDVGIISYYENNFPEILRKCKNEDGKLDPPILLYYRGCINALEHPGIAIIGTREPTPNGLLAGRYFSSEFARRKYNIISGLAVGCDTAAHQGALAVGGITTSFLANGLDWASIYPKENLELAKNIVNNGGLLLSEYPIGQPCGRYGLVARDRLQAGLSYATVVVQTGEEGGTMHAINATINSGKPLFAVEYKKNEDITHPKVQGNIKLINEHKAHPLSSYNMDNVIDLITVEQNLTKIPYQQTLF